MSGNWHGDPQVIWREVTHEDRDPQGREHPTDSQLPRQLLGAQLLGLLIPGPVLVLAVVVDDARALGRWSLLLLHHHGKGVTYEDRDSQDRERPADLRLHNQLLDAEQVVSAASFWILLPLPWLVMEPSPPLTARHPGAVAGTPSPATAPDGRSPMRATPETFMEVPGEPAPEQAQTRLPGPRRRDDRGHPVWPTAWMSTWRRRWPGWWSPRTATGT